MSPARVQPFPGFPQTTRDKALIPKTCRIFEPVNLFRIPGRITPLPANVNPKPIDLALHLGRCQADYIRLCKLIPDRSQRNKRFIKCPLGADNLLGIEIQIVTRSHYTDTVVINQWHICTAAPDSARANLPEWLYDFPSMKIGVYHDVHLIEVLAVGPRNLLSKGCPGKSMYNGMASPKDSHLAEKINCHRFLSELLEFCIDKAMIMPAPEVTAFGQPSLTRPLQPPNNHFHN